jgi:hypothetical protein
MCFSPQLLDSLLSLVELVGVEIQPNLIDKQPFLLESKCLTNFFLLILVPLQISFVCGYKRNGSKDAVAPVCALLVKAFVKSRCEPNTTTTYECEKIGSSFFIFLATS